MEMMRRTAEAVIRPLIRDVADFPKKGIVFKDLTPVMQNPYAFAASVDAVVDHFSKERIDAVAGIESRGFIFGAPVAARMNIPFIPIRKKGKLPWETESMTYKLEYGEDTIEMHKDAVRKMDKVLLVDDLLATGGTAEAACKLIGKMGGIVAGCAFVVELSFLHGRQRLDKYEIFSIIRFD